MIAPPRPPSHDELEALIKEARQRQLRRRLLGAAGVAVVTALALSVYAVESDPGPSASSPASSPSAAVAPCRAGQLGGTTFLQAATMSGVGSIMIANVSATACRLPYGTPSVRITWHGKNLRVDTRALGRQGEPARMLRPDAKAAIPLVWSNWCGRSQGMARLVFYARFANGLDVRAPQRVAWHPDCASRPDPSILGVGVPIRS